MPPQQTPNGATVVLVVVLVVTAGSLVVVVVVAISEHVLSSHDSSCLKIPPKTSHCILVRLSKHSP